MEASPDRPVLIVEDDLLVSTFFSIALQHGGFTSVIVSDGESALAEVRSNPHLALALIDGLLPDTHGAVLARRILEEPNGRNLAICFVTGALSNGSPVQAGVSALTKPVKSAELLAKVAEMIGGDEVASEAERHAALSRLEAGFLVGP